MMKIDSIIVLVGSSKNDKMKKLAIFVIFFVLFKLISTEKNYTKIS